MSFIVVGIILAFGNSALQAVAETNEGTNYHANLPLSDIFEVMKQSNRSFRRLDMRCLKFSDSIKTLIHQPVSSEVRSKKEDSIQLLSDLLDYTNKTNSTYRHVLDVFITDCLAQLNKNRAKVEIDSSSSPQVVKGSDEISRELSSVDFDRFEDAVDTLNAKQVDFANSIDFSEDIATEIGLQSPKKLRESRPKAAELLTPVRNRLSNSDLPAIEGCLDELTTRQQPLGDSRWDFQRLSTFELSKAMAESRDPDKEKSCSKFASNIYDMLGKPREKGVKLLELNLDLMRHMSAYYSRLNGIIMKRISENSNLCGAIIRALLAEEKNHDRTEEDLGARMKLRCRM